MNIFKNATQIKIGDVDVDNVQIPLDVWNELQDYKGYYDFDTYIEDMINEEPETIYSNTFYISNDNSIKKLYKAWYEPEEIKIDQDYYFVKVPDNWGMGDDNNRYPEETDQYFYKSVHTDDLFFDNAPKLKEDSHQQFTLEEIAKYKLDNFERVLVEDD